MNHIVNYIKVTENIHTAGQPTRQQLKQIAKNGFDVVINLAMHNRGALKQEDKIVTKAGMLYIHIPITWKNPEIERLPLFMNLLKSLQKSNKKVFIHCIKNYRVSVFMHRYKQEILQETVSKFVAPKEYQPNKIWKKILKGI